ncbi:MAG: M48 family metallopeptidase [Trichloromonadaceae bacterium]
MMTGMTLLLAYLFTLLAGYALTALNLRHLRRHGAEVPAAFAGAIDPGVLQKSSAYTFEHNRLGLLASVLANALLLGFLFTPLLPLYDRWVASLSDNFILGGLLFAFLLQLGKALVALPFSYYRTFQIEARYGFNTQSRRLWLVDLLKGSLIGTLLLALLLGGALWLIAASPQFWWLWVWGFFAAFSLLLMYVSPVLIEPLFFKFEPLRRQGLEEAIRALMARAGLEISRVFQVDASRRSRHSNAYFTGIARVKRIVLFDTLLAQMEDAELLAVLAHEVGHWKKRHIFTRLLTSLLLSLVGLYLAWRLMAWGGLPGLLGLGQASFYAQVLVLSLLASLAGFLFTPLASWWSRRDERQADRYATLLHGQPQALASALIKLSRDSLANLHPHPLYAAYYYSHPPVVQRVEALLAQQSPAE